MKGRCVWLVPESCFFCEAVYVEVHTSTRGTKERPVTLGVGEREPGVLESRGWKLFLL